MNGLEAIIFVIFVLFVLINLLIRFVVRKAKRGSEKSVPPAVKERAPESGYAGEEGGEEESWIPAALREVFEVEGALQQVSSEPGEEKIQKTQEIIEPAAQVADIPRTVEKEKIGAEMEARSEQWEKPRLEKLEGTIEDLAGKEEQEASFWVRLERLPTLQRAIVLSEVLGPPKGIQKKD